MGHAERVLLEQRPMLTEFLADVGLHEAGGPLDLRAILPAFDHWLRAQDVTAADVPYVASRLAAFVSVYLEDHAGATQAIVDGRILLRVPIEPGVVREFDAYRLAYQAAHQKPLRVCALLDALAPVRHGVS